MTDRQKRALNISVTVIFIIALVIFIIGFSIGLPIYCRFFYYIQIRTLDLPAQAAEYGIKADYAQIKQAYDEVLNFCTLPGREFGTGIFKWTETEKGHFADCKVLFSLDFWLTLCTGIVSLTLVLLNRFKVITFVKPLKRRAYFWAAVIAVALPVLIFLLVLIVGFDRAFEAFHAVFFPAKENWNFDPETEQIIIVMPQEFFMNCAIIIGVGLITFSGALIATDFIVSKLEKKKSEKSTEQEEKSDNLPTDNN